MATILKALIVFGTRPEAVKLAPVIMELGCRPDAVTVLCATGQHREMLDQVLEIFDLHPDHDLDVMTADQQPCDVAASVLRGVARVIEAEKPSVAVVQGDTTTAMAASLAAFFHRIPVAHVEAGLRTGKRSSPFPEELMRQIVGRVAELHFAPTARAAENLRREGADTEASIYLTGNTVVDAVKWIAARRRPKRPLLARRAPRLILLTAHRRENLGEPIRSICRAVRTIVDLNPDVEVAYPVHPNPNIQTPVHELLEGHERIHLVSPLAYDELVGLIGESYLVLTDSGGLQEEAPVFGKPVLVLRSETERPEAVEAGTARLGVDRFLELLGNANDVFDFALKEWAGNVKMLTGREKADRVEAFMPLLGAVVDPVVRNDAAQRIADILLAFGRRDLSAVGRWQWAPGLPERAAHSYEPLTT